MTFIDLTKVFDSVHREGLWKVLKKIGCPDKFVSIVRSFHDGMMGCVLDDGEISSPFDISHGTKQGCVLAPLLFSIFFAMMLLGAFKDCDLGVSMQFRTDGSVFNLRRLQARTRVFSVILRDLLYADDCVLLAHTESVAQQLFDRFSNAARRFGLTVSLKKTWGHATASKGRFCHHSSHKVRRNSPQGCGQILLSWQCSVFWRWHWWRYYDWERLVLPLADSLSAYGMIMGSACQPRSLSTELSSSQLCCMAASHGLCTGVIYWSSISSTWDVWGK